MWTQRAAQSALLVVTVIAIPNIGAALAGLAETFGTLPDSAALTAPFAGEDALPPKVRAMIGIARRRGLPSYVLAPTLAADNEVMQRMTEGAWPVRPDATSRHRFLARTEALPAGCLEQEAEAEVVYARCD